MKKNLILILKVIIFLFVLVVMIMVVNIFIETDINYKKESIFESFVSNFELFLLIIGLLILLFKILFLPHLNIKDYFY